MLRICGINDSGLIYIYDLLDVNFRFWDLDRELFDTGYGVGIPGVMLVYIPKCWLQKKIENVGITGSYSLIVRL